MAACAGYSKCSIRLVPRGKQQAQQEYSDRSTIEIRQQDCGDYTLRAIDVANDKTEIFNIQLISKQQYQFGRDANDPDKLETDSGTYYLSLSQPMRKNFHRDLCKCLNEVIIISQTDESLLEIDSDDDVDFTVSDDQRNMDHDDDDDDENDIFTYPPFYRSPPSTRRRNSDVFESRQSPISPSFYRELNSSLSEPSIIPPKLISPAAPPKTNPVNTPPKLEPAIVPPADLLHNTHNLGKFIGNGNEDAAARSAALLCQQGVQIQVKSLKTKKNDKKFTIQVQIDGNEYSIDQSGPKISVDVYQSTTVRELRAAFELAYRQLPPSQYFFVNGVLAQDDSSMKDLNVGSQSIFILFLLTHPKKF